MIHPMKIFLESLEISTGVEISINSGRNIHFYGKHQAQTKVWVQNPCVFSTCRDFEYKSRRAIVDTAL